MTNDSIMVSLSAAPMLSKVATEYLYHHVFLPPRLPQKDDYDAATELVLLDSVVHAMVEFKGHATEKQACVLSAAIEMLCRLRYNFGNHGDVIEGKLIENLKKFDHYGGFLPIHIRSQNAVMLLTEKKTEIHIEAFELSPRNESVYSTVGRLQRQFPGPTFALDRDAFKDEGLQHTIAQTLSKMSHQSVAGTKPKVRKAGQLHDEERDTTAPTMVTELFITFLRPQCTIARSTQIHKNTREEVLWLDCEMPWRRSPLWLLIRAILQLVIQRLRIQEDVTEDLYKHFMIYYMSVTLKLCHEKISTEWMYIMTAKIARRIRKLDLTNDPAWFSVVHDTLRGANNAIQKDWNKTLLRNRLEVDQHPIASLNFEKDIYCSLPDLDMWLEGIKGRKRSTPSVDFHPQPKLLYYQRTRLPSHLNLTDPGYDIFNLAIFENWVKSHLEDWLQVHVMMEQTCQQLKTLISCYYNLAEPVYSTNPEAVSIMLLTTLELWIACDKSALQIHPLLHDYDPCIPMDMFESLLLPHQSQMARLARAEAYIKQRLARVRYHGSGIFRDFGTSSCFPVRHFEQSKEHQSLLAAIEERASRERAEKHSELERKQRQYHNLCALSKEMKCTYDEVIVDEHFNMRERRHSPWCQKCSYMDQAEKIGIVVHEWPLSSNHLDAMSTVFELNTPRAFAWWRDTTIFFLNVLHIDYHVKDQPRDKHQPQSYGGLSSFFTPVEGAGRITLLSQNKPHYGTHRRDRKIINVTIDDICVNNGMHFQYFDEKVGCFVAEFDATNEITATSCTYKLPQPTSSLQQFLLRTATRRDGLPPNMVISSQHACPADMMLEEYRALCSMPFGVRIQWKNILRQLAMPSVVFKKAETCIFLLQIINQAGPAGDSVLRIGHAILKDSRFAAALLLEIRKSADRVKENWESSQELFALIMLTQRILTLSKSVQIHNLCLEYLSYTREIAFRWMGIVRDKANNTIEHKHRTELMAQSVEIALICVSTFDTETTYLCQILEQTLEATIYFQCCMMIQDHENIINMASNCLLPIMFFRWKATSYRFYCLIADKAILVKELTAALDEAIAQMWAAYRKGSLWSTVSEKNNYWLVTRMSCESSEEDGLHVHYNILTGELLINGQPLASLPSDYERHNTYTSLFGRSFVEVMPSSLPGMQFSVQREHMGHTVHLGKHSILGSDKFDLCVRAVKENEVWEFVSPRLLTGLFPDAFVENYVHWYNLNGGYLEFRPATEPWINSDAHWRLRKRCAQRDWCLTKNNISLVSLRSDTARLISMILKPIERASKVHFKLHVSSSMLEIEIPRLRVDFSLGLGQSSIISRQYPDMVIDADQSLETLVGLRNKLILIHVNTLTRIVLVPEGDVTWKKDIGHVAVEIGWQATASLHAYSVDSQLGRLVDNGSLQSKLILSYLHATTSSCVPDPLTQMTGTEQALSILRSASMRSFVELHTENITILEKIARLTPRRKFYPANERVMQSVHWQENLGCLTQHDDFREQVLDIFTHHRRMEIFHTGIKADLPSLPDIDAKLLRRSRIRSSTFRVSNFGAEEHTTQHDYLYLSLGRGYQSEECLDVFTLCKVLHDEIASTEMETVGTIVSRLWELLSRPEEVHGPEVQISKAEIRYDASYILEPLKFVSTYWCSIHGLLCSETSRPNKYEVMMWLSTLAFSKKINMAILRVIAAIYMNPQVRLHLPPLRSEFHPYQGYEVKENDLRSDVRSAIRLETPEAQLPPLEKEDYFSFQKRKQRLIEQNRNHALDDFITDVRLQWPTDSPSIPACQKGPKFHDYFDTQKAMIRVKENFSVWFHNSELRQYLADIASAVVKQRGKCVEMPSYHFRDTAHLQCPSRGFVSVDDILGEPLGPCPALAMDPPRLDNLLWTSSSSVHQVPRLVSLISTLDMRKRSDYETFYVEQLRASVKSLQDLRKPGVILDHSDLRNTLQTYLNRCAEHSVAIYEAIISRMSFSGVKSRTSNGRKQISYNIWRTLSSGYTFPRLSQNLFLQQLTRKRWPLLPEGWKRCFIAYGRSITALQRAKRLLSLVDHHEDLIQELQNPGHSNWDPYDFPESLLLEIENGILIRDVQEQIAQRMRGLRPRQNAVMQLNMGEGKSSVIVPIVAADFANGSSLVRVLVAKPQSRQMHQMLVSKLGGLLDRQIYQLPISRSLRIDVTEANEIGRMCCECMEQGGILLVQPEHILSLKLMCLEAFITGRNELGKSILRTLELFRKSSRDIVDESDENFNVKFELIYTMGTQQHLEFSPQRWMIIQELLDLFKESAVEIKGDFLRSIEVVNHRAGSFPRIRILHETVAQEILDRIAQHVCQKGIDSMTIMRQGESSTKPIMAYILKRNLSAREIGAVETEGSNSFWTESTKDSLILLRGLLAGGVLAFCFGQKRWRVNYGPDDTRRPPTKLSVPYRAKDNPAPRSEFSHPDVVIVLTCLNYYYGGLSDDELFHTFHHLIRSDQGEAEFQSWLKDTPQIPQAYRQLSGINLQDRVHCLSHVFPYFRFSKGAIDYYLCQTVFPREIKEFPYKLSASGWDIGEIKRHPTVGFSGTNDSRVTLPLSVEQLDLPEQNHTNALVLEYLLRPENSVILSPASSDGSKSDAQRLLDMVLDLVPPIQVILDVGAQVLELTNLEVAQIWLRMTSDSTQRQAVIFVDDHDTICVLDRAGVIEPLQYSPYAQQLGACYVFLDEAHTRGIDLRLPPTYRAAVTLGAGITKDKLVQACMRMRKLGKGQSVVFCIPEEIKTKICSLSAKSSESVEVSDVLCWAISETWVEMQRSIPLWAVQGERFERQNQLWRSYSGQEELTQDQASRFLEDESQTLEQRYRPGRNPTSNLGTNSPKTQNMERIIERCQQFGDVSFSTQLEEEQERELAPEIEQERQIQRPPPARPKDHNVHQHLRSFVSTGVLAEPSTAFRPAFEVFKHTSVAKHPVLSQFPNQLLVTSDFAETVWTPVKRSYLDHYQRPVEWVLTSRDRSSSKIKHMVVISSHEANELLFEVQKSELVTMHLYAPRQNLSFPALDDLGLYIVSRNLATFRVPRVLKIQLNLFAGQLYASSYDEYLQLCKFLGVSSSKKTSDCETAADGFILAKGEVSMTTFTQSPLKCLKTLMSQIRKDGQEISKTHLGRILDGKLLYSSDFGDFGGSESTTLSFRAK